MELGNGLSFPATEYLSHIMHTQALQGWFDSLSLFTPPLFQIVLSFSHLSLSPLTCLSLSSSISSAVSGPGLPSCQRHGLHSDQRAQGPVEAVPTARSATSFFQIAGMPFGLNLNVLFSCYTKDKNSYVGPSVSVFPPSSLFWRFSSQLICRASGTQTAWRRRCRWRQRAWPLISNVIKFSKGMNYLPKRMNWHLAGQLNLTWLFSETTALHWSKSRILCVVAFYILL